MSRTADGLVSVAPKRLVFSKTSVSKTQCCKLKLKNRDQKTVVVIYYKSVLINSNLGPVIHACVRVLNSACNSDKVRFQAYEKDSGFGYII